VEVPTQVYSLLHAATFATLTNVNFDDARFKVRRRLGAGMERDGHSWSGRIAQVWAPG
jgi:hypothetical protein